MAIIRVNGQDVELPQVMSFDIDEAMVLYDYSGLTLDQIDESTSMHPGYWKTLVHVAVQRANPDLEPAEVKKAVGKVKLTEYLASFKEPEEREGDALPPSPSKNSSENSESSGPDGGTSSEEDAETEGPKRTGLHALATSASPQTRSAV